MIALSVEMNRDAYVFVFAFQMENKIEWKLSKTKTK